MTPRWRVSIDGAHVLTVVGAPGPLVSTGSRPRGTPPPTHPFLSATAHDAAEESALRALLEQSSDLPDFLGHLAAAGYEVRREA